MGEPGSESVLSSLRGPLRAIGSVVFPTSGSLDEQGWLEAEAIMEEALAPKPTGVKRQIRLFLRVVNLLPVFSKGRTLEGLSLEGRAAFLQRLQRSPLQPLRRGLWGIRTLIFMGFYNQDAIRQRIGYGADPKGWQALPEEDWPGPWEPDSPGDSEMQPGLEGGERLHEEREG